jgi:hypothetical protein
MRTMNFDAIATAAPLNREASVVRDGSGEIWDGKVPSFHAHWDAPPLPEAPRPLQAPPLEGTSFGRMIVIRYHRAHKKNGAQWLCRCTCGAYELRNTPAVRRLAAGNAGNEEDHCCAKCDWLRHIKFKARSPQTAETRAAELAGFERLAGTDGAKTCRDCRTPATCRWSEQCALYSSEAA